MGEPERPSPVPATITASQPSAGEQPVRAAVEATGPARYRIEGEVARGGTGMILRAADLLLGRDVAIKRALRPDPLTMHRFRREVQITARLQHPGIIPLYDAGEWSYREPYFSMKLVEGGSLRELFAAAPTLDERLAALPRVVAVSEAVAYAHSRGVVHRDLKPSNVLVGAFDETVVIDWGLAKHVSDADVAGADEEPIVDAQLTMMGEVAGTPAYMPPEQAEGLERCGKPGDVYALGAMLYHLLCGAPPFAGEARTVIDALRKAPPVDVDVREPAAPPDLVAIVARAMRRDPAERYASAEQFADDLRRFLTGRLVVARRYTWFDLVRRFVRRYRWRLALAAIVLIGAATQGVIAFQRISSARNVAQNEADLRFFAEVDATIENDPERAVALLKTYPRSGVRTTRAANMAVEAIMRGVPARIYTPRNTANRLAYSPDGASLALAERYVVEVMTTANGHVRALQPALPGVPSAILWLSASSLVACDDTGLVLLWDRLDQPARTLSHGAGCNFAAVGSEGRILLGFDDALVAWDPTSGTQTTLAPGLWQITQSGRALSTGPQGVTLVDPNGAKLADIPATNIGRVAVSRDGTHVVIAAAEGLVEWTASGVRHIPGVDPKDVRMLATPDGDRVLALVGDQLTLYQAGAVVKRRTLPNVSPRFRFSPASDAVVLFDRNGSIEVVALDTLEVQPLRGSLGMVWDAAWSPDGRSIATSARDRKVRIWPAIVPAVRIATLRTYINRIAWSPRGRSVWIHGHDANALWVLDEPAPRLLGALSTVSPENTRLASVSKDTLELLDAEDGRSLGTATVPGASALAFADSHRILVGNAAGAVELRDVAAGTVEPVTKHDGAVVGIDTGGNRAAIAWKDRLRVVDLGSHAVRELATPRPIDDFTIAPDGTSVVWVSAEHVFLWHVGEPSSRELGGPTLEIAVLIWSPSGDRIYASSRDGTLWSWNPATGVGRAIARHATPTIYVEVTASQLFATTIDGTLRVSGLDGEDAHVIAFDPEEIYAFSVSPDRTKLATGNGFGRVVLRDLPPSPDWTKVDWRHWLDERTTVTFDDLPVGR
ncbi:MAG: protein kinase [Deltaproteobacteria bacterium]|nr:protein kinase [Deltaproteobacteria bacterium]